MQYFVAPEPGLRRFHAYRVKRRTRGTLQAIMLTSEGEPSFVTHIDRSAVTAWFQSRWDALTFCKDAEPVTKPPIDPTVNGARQAYRESLQNRMRRAEAKILRELAPERAKLKRAEAAAAMRRDAQLAALRLEHRSKVQSLRGEYVD